MDIPIFPLNTVLFPGGVLPLKIFEQRYLEMTKVCLRDTAPFGVCLIREGIEVGAPALPAEVGCLARIVDWEMPQPGIFHLKAEGTQRFRLLQRQTQKSGLITGQVDLLAADQPMAADSSCRRVLELIIERVGERYFPSPRLDDASWVGYRLAEMLPLALATRQEMLELDLPQQRIDFLRRYLQQQGLA
jgi:Lon protease-like protein